jgi:hypothetical protein
MPTRGMVYLVRARRSDGVWINYRTCDQHEAKLVADAFGVAVTIAAGS